MSSWRWQSFWQIWQVSFFNKKNCFSRTGFSNSEINLLRNSQNFTSKTFSQIQESKPKPKDKQQKERDLEIHEIKYEVRKIFSKQLFLTDLTVVWVLVFGWKVFYLCFSSFTLCFVTYMKDLIASSETWANQFIANQKISKSCDVDSDGKIQNQNCYYFFFPGIEFSHSKMNDQLRNGTKKKITTIINNKNNNNNSNNNNY